MTGSASFRNPGTIPVLPIEGWVGGRWKERTRFERASQAARPALRLTAPEGLRYPLRQSLYSTHEGATLTSATDGPALENRVEEQLAPSRIPATEEVRLHEPVVVVSPSP